MAIDEDIIGTGWGFPMGVDARGGIRMARGVEDIEESIRLIVGTAPGERRMRPRFGCNIAEYVFSPMDGTNSGIIRYWITDALQFWEPRIEVKDVRVWPDPDVDGTLLISVTYVVRSSGDERNLVYPFYTIPEER